MKLFITLTGVMVMNVCVACDFCGCYMGITPYDNQSSISMLYRYKSYNGYSFAHQEHRLFPARIMAANGSYNNTGRPTVYNMKHGASGASSNSYLQKDFEIYTTAELRAKYFIHQRFEMNIILPFVMNRSNMNSEKQYVQSAGDITLLGSWRLIDKTLAGKFQRRFIAGGGIKLPTGIYKAKSEDGDRIDPMLQSGTGSTDYLVYINYIISYHKLGLNLNSTYKMNGVNSLHERVGNSSASYLNIFCRLREDKDLKLFPSVQAYYEYTNGFYTDKKYQNGTTINMAMAGLGLDVYYKHISLNTSFQLPLFEELIPSDPSCAGRFIVGLTYSFNQSKYLIRKKRSEN